MIFEYIQVAFRSIISHKVRALLTMLGVIIGVGAVTLLSSLGNSAKYEAENQIRAMGSNLVMVNYSDLSGYLSKNWLEDIKEDANIVSYSEFIEYDYSYNINDEQINFKVVGVNNNYGSISNLKFSEGNFFDILDYQNNLPVCVVGSKIKEKLLAQDNVLNSVIMIKGIPFKIVGAIEDRGSSFMGDLDSYIYIPKNLALSIFDNDNIYASNNKTYYLTIENEEKVAKATSIISSYLENKLPGKNLYFVFSQSQVLNLMDSIMSLLTSFVGGIASISLIVGGIGIMNIMLVTVRERTKEIGIRKALGATNGMILLQFLIEAIIITILGGIIGLVLSYVGAAIISYLSNFHVFISIESAIFALIFSLIIGVIFGIYPAYKASNLEVVDALRFE